MAKKVLTAKGRALSSTRWLQRHLNDPYVAQAKKDGYRSRAAYKLLEIDAKFKLLKKGATVIDLGCAPGSWTQVVTGTTRAPVIGLDLLPVQPLPGASIIQLDFLADDAPARLQALLSGPADVVLSDIAPNTTGHKATDHIRLMTILQAVYDFATQVLKPGGSFVAKVFEGGAGGSLLTAIKQDFATVAHFKPKASRKESVEYYLIATGFKGRQ
jgi:23S rRNA (uridine2552-2'-O)-methyltransferase